MINNKFKLIVAMLLVVAIIGGCQSATQEKTEKIVYTSIYPLYEAANKISGDNLTVKLVIPNGAELHSYRPSPKKIANLEQADLFFYNGLGLEPWADKAVSNLEQSSVKAVNISQHVNLIKFNKNKNLEEEHNHQEQEEHSDYDPHLWLDPLNMKLIAQKMKSEFQKLDSANKDVYQKNYQSFVQKIDKLDQKYHNTLKNKEQEYILVSHAAFGYLANRYNFQQLSVTGVAPHEEPSPGVLAELTNKAKEHNLDYIFMETLANPKTVDILAQEADLQVLKLNPIAGLTKKENKAGEDYFSLMDQNLDNLEKALVN
ncbi:MAG: metal ABC transporter solute-binding protein, Zn/Mn family [Bacillota bacterium]